METSRPSFDVDLSQSSASRSGTHRSSIISLSKGLPTSGATSSVGVVINLVTGALGSGILSLPWSTAGATLVPAVTIIGVVLLVNAWTIQILVKAAERYQAFDLGSLLAQLPGWIGTSTQLLCNIVVWASLFLCLVGYFVIIADSATRAGLEGRVHRTVIIAAACVWIIPLCFLDQKRLAFTSTLTVIINVYILGILIHSLAGGSVSGSPCVFNLGTGTIAMVTAMMQSVIIQMCILPMYEDLKDRSPQKFAGIIRIAFAIIFVLFVLFSCAGQIVYGLDVESNILKDLPRNGWGIVAQSGTVLAISGVFPLMLMPMLAPVRNSTWRPFVAPITVGITLASAIVAVFFTDLGFLNVINGALQVGVFVGLVPAVVGIYLLRKSRIALIALAVISFVVSILGFVYTDNYASNNDEKHCLVRKLTYSG